MKCPKCNIETDLFTCKCGVQLLCTICEEVITEEVYDGGTCEDCYLLRERDED